MDSVLNGERGPLPRHKGTKKKHTPSRRGNRVEKHSGGEKGKTRADFASAIRRRAKKTHTLLLGRKKRGRGERLERSQDQSEDSGKE